MSKYRQNMGIKPKQYIVRDAPTTQSYAQWMLPIIAERQKVANDIVPVKFWQYNQLRYRSCSCYQGSSDPDVNCRGCFGTGFLPGYKPVGYYSWVVMDIGDPGLLLTNVEPVFSSGKRPYPLQLSSTALMGIVETQWQGCSKNKGGIDIYYSGSTDGITLQFTVDGFTWIALTDNMVSEVIKTATQVKFRAILQRTSLEEQAPYIQVLHARVQVQEDPLIRLDVPRWVANLSSDDGGLIPILNTFNAYADARYKLEQVSVFVHSVSKRKFKTLSLNPNMPDGVLTSWDAELRLVQPDEPLNQLV